jgi:hypothetical protein
LIFMQWLMTHKDAADILTFGSQLMELRHYRFSENTIYAFYNLTANFSDKAFLGGKYDTLIRVYRERTYQAKYPIILQVIDSDDDNNVDLKLLFLGYSELGLQSQARNDYLRKQSVNS